MAPVKATTRSNAPAREFQGAVSFDAVSESIVTKKLRHFFRLHVNKRLNAAIRDAPT